MKNGKIYMIQHNVTNRMYIGRSQDVERRIYQHFTMLRAGQHPIEDMQDDFKKYGDNYTITILGEATAENGLEIKMMDKYQSCVRGIGYNYKDPHVTASTFNACKKRSEKALIHRIVDGLDDEKRACALKLLTEAFGEAKQPQTMKQQYISAIVKKIHQIDDLQMLDLVLKILEKSSAERN